MKEESSQEVNSCAETKGPIPKINANEFSDIKKVIGVLSGKGGVGKSLVTGLLAVSLAKQGFRVGIMDADITGPSIPKMFGINSRPESHDFGLLPVKTSLGIAIMSLNLILEHEDDPVIWRGPLIAGVVKQFYTDVVWGNLDYLLIDMPPGTGDVPLTVMQSLPVDGVVIVSSPQDLAVMVVKKAIKMAAEMQINILGLIENMSSFVCPHCGQEIKMFGSSQGESVAKTAGIPYLGAIPLDNRLARYCDQGKIESYESDLFNDITAWINDK